MFMFLKSVKTVDLFQDYIEIEAVKMISVRCSVQKM